MHFCFAWLNLVALMLVLRDEASAECLQQEKDSNATVPSFCLFDFGYQIFNFTISAVLALAQAEPSDPLALRTRCR